MNRFSVKTLHEGWELLLVDDASHAVPLKTVSAIRAAGKPLDAHVPGDWPLDYVRHGLLPDPFYGDNYLRIRDYETHHVYYACSFTWDRPVNDLVFLRFDGLDTIADVYLNGMLIGHAENMFIPHEFAAASLKTGENELVVHFSPVALEARKYPIAAHHTALKYNYESLVIRKPAHSFGWDICPRIVSAGIWRDVTIIEKKPERIESISLWVDRLAGNDAHCHAAFDIDIGREPVQPYTLRIDGKCGASVFTAEQKLWFTHGRISFTVSNALLWQVRGYGEPHLYDITVTLLKNDAPVDTMHFRQGLRTVELIRDDIREKHHAAAFSLRINGKPIFVKGTNWVPADAFHSRDAERIPQILPMVTDIGCNALRIWGGGVYENDYFYDWCDENGIIVWQDFMMACGVYPQTERMRSQLTEEATVIVRRLRHHACICLWAGDNECDTFYNRDTCGRIDPNRNSLTREILPNVLLAEDVTRPYLPSSPYISPASHAANKPFDTPEQHLWGPRCYFKDPFYHDHHAVFASEMGYHGCSSPASLRRYIPEDHLWPAMGDPMWLYHAASPELTDSPYTYRIGLMTRQIGYLFRQQPDSLDSYARMSQICQAEAKKYFVESFRSRRDERTGLIWWNLIDNWDQLSDAVVDYSFCKKLAYHFIRRSQQPVCLMIDDHPGRHMLYGVSDLQQPVRVQYSAEAIPADGGVPRRLAEGTAVLSANASMALGLAEPDGAAFIIIRWTAEDGTTGLNHYLYGKAPFDADWYLSCLQSVGLDEFEGFDE